MIGRFRLWDHLAMVPLCLARARARGPQYRQGNFLFFFIVYFANAGFGQVMSGLRP